MSLRSPEPVRYQAVPTLFDRLRSLAIPILLPIASAGFAYLGITRLGMQFFVVLLMGAVCFAILAAVSLKDLSLALSAWMLSMAGFRYLGMVQMPGLPDFSFDRLLLIWIGFVFFLRILISGRKPHGPFVADILIITHSIYLLVQMQFHDPHHLHEWVASSLAPLFGFWYGKYVITRDREIRNLLIFFLLLLVHYSIQSIAEHFHLNFLVWPKAVLDPKVGFWAAGRSRGPVLHPPLFGQLIAILTVVSLFFIARARTRTGKFLGFLTLGGGLLGNFFAFTRGPWMALAAGILAMGALRPNYRKILFTLAIVGLIGGMVGLLQLANTPFLQERLGANNTISNRLGFMANALRMFRDHPLFGIGYFQFFKNVKYYNTTTYVPLWGMIRASDSDHVPIHDIYIGRLAEEGLFGSLLMFAFYVVIFRAFRRRWHTIREGRWYNKDLLGLLAGMMICYMVGGTAIDYRFFSFVNVLFMLPAGIIYGLDHREDRLLAENPDFRPDDATESAIRGAAR